MVPWKERTVALMRAPVMLALTICGLQWASRHCRDAHFYNFTAHFIGIGHLLNFTANKRQCTKIFSVINRAVRKDFILSKYMEWQFAQRSSGSPETKRKYLQDAVRSRDVFSLLQLYAERTDLSQPLPCHLQVRKHVSPSHFLLFTFVDVGSFNS